MASEKWAGFTDEDIERIKTNPVNRKNNSTTEKNGIFKKESSEPLKIREAAVESVKNKNFISDSSKDETSDSDPDFKRKPFRSKRNSKSKETSVPNGILENATNCSNSSVDKNAMEASDILDEPSEGFKQENPREQMLVIEQNSSLVELEMFDVRQKRIEAENARRRVLINKAIRDKKMQTQAEAMKLAKITQELNRLDGILSADVSILRDYIEEASLEFSKAEKRYLKAEKEFIEAKFYLYEKMQRKEQLTEHLCAIIEQNENRKANKLVELMKQLEMEGIIEDYDTKESQPILSKFCHLNDETYHCCQTLKPISQKAPSDGSVQDEDETPNVCHEQTQVLDILVDSMENENFGLEKST